MRLAHLVVAAAAAFSFSTAAKAADWTGFYAGVMGGASAATFLECGDCVANVTNIAKVVGYNWDNGDTVFGLEEWVIRSFNSEVPPDYFKLTWQKLARFGWEIGDSALIYVAGGGGVHALWELGEFEGAVFFAAAGAGAEFLVSDQLSLRVHGQFSYAPEVEGTAVSVASIGAGVVFHFN